MAQKKREPAFVSNARFHVADSLEHAVGSAKDGDWRVVVAMCRSAEGHAETLLRHQGRQVTEALKAAERELERLDDPNTEEPSPVLKQVRAALKAAEGGHD